MLEGLTQQKKKVQLRQNHPQNAALGTTEQFSSQKGQAISHSVERPYRRHCTKAQRIMAKNATP